MAEGRDCVPAYGHRMVRVGEGLSAGHLVVAVDQVVVQGGLGGGVHGAGLGETSPALQVVNGGGGRGARWLVSGWLVAGRSSV